LLLSLRKSAEKRLEQKSEAMMYVSVLVADRPPGLAT
jgi:hypothetical protein